MLCKGTAHVALAVLTALIISLVGDIYACNTIIRYHIFVA
jgi:hypothetical protein